MSRLIDADDLLTAFPIDDEPMLTTSCVRMTIRRMPTIEDRKMGKWVHDGREFQHGCDWVHCSVCGKRGINVPADLTNYCPNCGARMRGEEHG